MPPQTGQLGILHVLTTLDLISALPLESRNLAQLSPNPPQLVLAIGSENLASLLEGLVRQLFKGERVGDGPHGEAASARANGHLASLYELRFELG